MVDQTKRDFLVGLVVVFNNGVDYMMTTKFTTIFGFKNEYLTSEDVGQVSLFIRQSGDRQVIE